MKTSESQFPRVRGLRYHVRIWGKPSWPTLFLLHGWMDVSASFQFLVDEMGQWRFIAPDWRGFGLSEWAQDGYWFPDYLADLDALLDLYSPGEPARLVGHSLGGNVACLYAGIRPERVERLATLEGFGLSRAAPESAPERYGKWLAQLKDPPRLSPYASFAAVATRLRKNNPRLSPDRAAFLARHWAGETSPGKVELRADPRHKRVNPILYRLEESLACWARITAPVLWVLGADSPVQSWFKENPADYALRKSAFKNLAERVIPEAGHMLHHDQPQALACLLEDFFDQRGG